MNTPMYIRNEEFQGDMPPLKAGKTSKPEVIVNGGSKATGKIVFTGNILAADTATVNGVAFTAKAAAAAPVGKSVFTGNLVTGNTVTVNGVVFTCMASAAAGELQFN